MSTDHLSVELVLRGQQRDAQAVVNRGFVAIALVPFAVIGLAVGWLEASYMAIVIAALCALFGGCFGVLCLIHGFVDMHRAERELRRLDESRLPRARLLQ